MGSKGTAIWNGIDSPYAEVVDEDDGFMRKCRRVESDVAWTGPDAHTGCLDDMVDGPHRRPQANDAFSRQRTQPWHGAGDNRKRHVREEGGRRTTDRITIAYEDRQAWQE